MAGETNTETLGIYVSVPFCRAKCSFCNFASGVSTPEIIEPYIETLCAEIDGARLKAARLSAQMPRSVDTVYFGGGTPSLLQPEQLRSVFAALRRNFDLKADAEITLEAAPGQIADDVLNEALELGVNRVSLGVQSFVDGESMAVGRSHTAESCVLEFERLRSAGVCDLGADLIAGLPYQTEESWAESLRAVTGANLTHVSVYMFEVDEDSRLGREVMSGGLRLHAPRVPDEDFVAGLYERACDVLPASGYEQYEISNFAKPGFASRHNRKYWERKPYLGFGLDAHSMLCTKNGAVRFANGDDLATYQGQPEANEITKVSSRDAFEESVFLGLRLLEGVPLRSLREAFPKHWMSEVNASALELATEGLMQVDEERWRLTGRGRLVSSEVFGHLLAGVAAGT